MWRDRTNLYLLPNRPYTVTKIKLTIYPSVASSHTANPIHITLPPKSHELQEASPTMLLTQKNPEDSCPLVLTTTEML
jgi:hypothetical protein